MSTMTDSAMKEGAPQADPAPSSAQSVGEGVLIKGQFRIPGTVPEEGSRLLDGAFPPSWHTKAFLRAIFPGQVDCGQYFEVVHGVRDGHFIPVTRVRGRHPMIHERTGAQVLDKSGNVVMEREVRPDCVVPVSDPMAAMAPIAAARALTHETFVGVLPRVFDDRGLAIPNKRYVNGGALIWVDIDDPDQVWRLTAFEPRPHLIVMSGSGGAHGYWRVRSFTEDGSRALSAAAIEKANGRLVRQMLGDPASRDRLRMMRVPGTMNTKRGAWARVVYADLLGGSYEIADVVGDLPDIVDKKEKARLEREERRAANGGVVRDYGPDPAKEVFPEDYVEIISDEICDENGYCACPLPGHDERTGSFKAYESVERGWWCYGCERGGDIYNFGRYMLEAIIGREATFPEVKEFVYEKLGLPKPQRRRR